MNSSCTKVALPLDSTGGFSSHYGAATRFTVFAVDVLARRVLRQLTVVPEDSKPCAWPTLLRMAGVKLVIAGGMGAGAQEHMRENGLWVLVGARGREPEEIVQRWLEERLETGDNACRCDGAGHGHDHDHEHSSGEHAAHGHGGHGCGCHG